MKASLLRSLWISFAASFCTASICFLAVCKQLFSKIDRKWVDKIAQRWSKCLLKLARVHCVVINPRHIEPIPGKATIIMSNHSSLYDIPLIFQAFPHHSIRMLAKKELSRIPIMGSAMVATGFPFIDRHNRHQAIQDLNAVKDLLQSGVVMWISPEGTRSRTGHLGEFKKGGFITAIDVGATIIPFGIRGAFDILPAKTTRFNINQKVEIHIGEPIDASLYTRENKDELIAKTHHALQALLTE